ncbi:MAG TPA: hypothetical protein VF800_25800 [Telluria sp.]|jgi:hypothetical protein
MFFKSTPHNFAVLQELGIVVAGDYERVLAHPDRAELFGCLELDDYTVWLVGRGFSSREKLEESRARIIEFGTGYQYVEMIERAQYKMLVLEARASHACFGTLAAEGIITEDERDHALAIVLEDELINSPAAALVWMLAKAEMSPERLDEICAVDGGSARRARIITDAAMLFHRLDEAARAAASRTPFPWRWLWFGAALLAVGTAMRTPAGPAPVPVPECNDAAFVRTINRGLAGSSPAHDGMSIAMARGRPMPRPALDHFIEVGFASETGIRGCFARLTGGDRAQVYAYTLARHADGKHIALRAANASFVQARYGYLDAKGRFLYRADPIGRDGLRKAFHAAADQITGGMLDPQMIAQLRRTVDRKVRHAVQDPQPEHVRRIVDIEPLAPCRDLGSGNSFSCRLLVEHNDPASVVLGGEANVHEGDFTVVRDGPGGAWRMGIAFGAELAAASASTPPTPPAPP